MDVIKQKRTVVRSQTTKLLNRIENKLAQKDAGEDEIEELLAEIQQKQKDLESLDSEIEPHLKLEEVEAEMLKIDEYKTNIVICITRLNRENRKNIKVHTDVSTNVSSQKETVIIKSNQSHINLPRLIIERYDGTPADFQRFWDQFDAAIHKNSELSNIDKFNYLKSYVTGIAADAIKGLFLSNENYETAIETLKDRFGRKTILINTHLNNLLNLSPVKKSSDTRALRSLLDNVNTEIKNLEALGLAQDNYSALMCPIIIKTLPPDIVLSITRNSKNDQELKIEDILTVFENEVLSREKACALIKQNETVKYDSPTFYNEKKFDKFDSKPKPNVSKFPSAHALINDTKDKNTCFLCHKAHLLQECQEFKAKDLKDKLDFLRKNGRCFICFFKNHMARSCRSSIRCRICNRRHYEALCPDQKRKAEGESESTSLSNKTSNTPEVIMQTISVYIINKNKKLKIRGLLDSGSQKSYITKKIIEKIGYKPLGEKEMTHSLFGGVQKTHQHKKYKVYLGALDGKYHCDFEVFDQPIICTNVPKIRNGPLMKEIKNLGLKIPDSGFSKFESEEINLLIGADIYGKLLTGKLRNLKYGVVAIETKLGWTLMGKVNCYGRISDSTSTVLSLHVNEAQITDLWRLDTLGILEPGQKEDRRELERATEEHFRRNIKVTDEGRYEVSLPWVHGHPPLPNIRVVAEKRLEKTITSLKKIKKLENYENVFEEWVEENIIEEISQSESSENEHFLPHRAVFKENSSTTIRPVFDGSAREKGSPSLNECLEKGPNLVELIPAILTRFRLRKIGVISDIRKAFLQIQLNEKDRSFLKFLWWKQGDPNNLKVFQHRRVVFGLSCSPYLLGATLNYHLENAPEQFKDTARKLAESFYIDNCVTSVDNEELLKQFISESKYLLSLAKFDLRGWENNELPDQKKVSTSAENKCVPVLGLMWNLTTDTLTVDLRDTDSNEDSLTKRKILSSVHKIFDPIGFACPITLSPKIMLQECWQSKVTWDTELPIPIKKKFKKWKDQLKSLKELAIPRCVISNPDATNELSLHVFCDASKVAYATCIFLRSSNNESISCQLIQARSRVAPLKHLTIPRLELLACTIGARLARNVTQDLRMVNIPIFYWSDSANVLFWIKRNENWAPFVYNRVQEILSISKPEDWNYVPGSCNPADLPSRGCSVEQLVKSRWWEGPPWLKELPKFWPKATVDPDYEVVDSERKRTVIAATNVSPPKLEFFEHSTSYTKLIRVTAWIYRFFHNSKAHHNRNSGPFLSIDEIKSAELVIFKYVQRICFVNETETRSCFRSLNIFTDNNGLLRVKTRIAMREDLEAFRFPILLPDGHNITQCLISSRHEELSHAGTQIVMSSLREQFWILRCRKTVQRILRKCVKCRRYTSHPIEVTSPPLPEDRVREALIFEVIGIDLCGPLFLKGHDKSWVVLFTCAIFRAIHVELVTSLSTESFLLAFRRFISRRGRPKVVYSDNGTNFTRSSAELRSVNFERVIEYSTTRKIQWKFNPPSAPWWGGFFERMIGILKSILRRVLGKACLQYEECYTVLCDIESVVNSRPLTYISEDVEDLVPLTPAMFLQEIRDSSVPDMDMIDATKMKRRYAYRQKIREDLRKRFRLEYLGQLKDFAKRKKEQKINVADIILIGDNNIKRINWPLGKVEETFPGKDGKIRVVKVKTQTGSYLRPVRKLFHLEVRDS